MRIARGLVGALSVWCLIGSAGVASGQSIPEQDLEEARDLYREARFAEAIVKLQQLVERLRPLRDAQARRLQLADAYQYLGLSQLAVNDLSSARESLKGMIRLDRERRLDPEVYAPKVIELFEEARAQVAAEPASRLASSPPPTASGNRRSRTPLVLLGVGAAAAAVGIQRASGGNKPPAAGSITVSPTSAGMAGLTTYTFRASGASDPDGDRLTYNWEFGDGGTGSGETATHVYANAGTYSITLKVSDGKLQAPASSSVSVNRNMTGIWTGRHSRIGNAMTITFTQSGTSLGGTLTLEPVGSGTTGSTRPLTGSISGANNFACPCEVSFVATGSGIFPLEGGQVDATVNLLTGPGNVDIGVGILSGVWTLTRR